MDQFIEVTLGGLDAVCVDPDQGFFREGHRDSYKILCKVPAAWVGTGDLPQRLLKLAESVNTDQTNALLEQGSMVGHFLLKGIDYRILGNEAPQDADRHGYCIVGEDGRYQWSKPTNPQ